MLQRIDVRNRSACPTPRRVLSKPMSEHKVTLTWQRGDKPFDYQKYSRDHTWKFPGGHEMQASAAPEYLGNQNLVDPEEAFVASLSSCHMLTFLAIACKKKFVLDETAAEILRRETTHPAGNRGDESWRARAMLHRQLGKDRGESRTANVSDRFVVAAAVSAAGGKAFGTNASTTFSDPCNLRK